MSYEGEPQTTEEQPSNPYEDNAPPADEAPEAENPYEEGTAESNIEDEAIDSFDNMGLKPDLLRGIYAYGFEKPSTIQQRAILPFTRGRDIIAQAQSGTGKTATFAVGILQSIDNNVAQAQALILAPTRELAQQIQKATQALGDYLKVRVHACIGGTRVRDDLAALRQGVHVVVGTPGRVFDMLSRRALPPSYIKAFVLDEADEMLSLGFKEQIYEIFRKLPSDVQVGLFSATMPRDALEITKKFMNKPIQILVKQDELTLEGIRQFFINVERGDWKLETLIDLYETISISQAVIFCNTRRKVDWLTDQLRGREFTVSATVRLHSLLRILLCCIVFFAFCLSCFHSLMFFRSMVISTKKSVMRLWATSEAVNPVS
mmetsp:Transcript_21008/g.23422  ORF Transcript_21008/g.23422 Transcript_21008/m.23422 type:complete len:375 (-) Transcript_21008:373-1497(-)